jgi:acylphosphatase
MAELHVIVHGRVQGVGYRWFVREHARRLDLVGWVKNRTDGTVEVLAAGTEDTIDALRRLLGEGPSGASVARLEDVGVGGSSSESAGAGSSFVIHR